jgi:hypothetical protein
MHCEILAHLNLLVALYSRFTPLCTTDAVSHHHDNIAEPVSTRQ